MIDILAGIFGDMLLDKARGEMGPVSPIPRTLSGAGGDAVRLKALEREHERLKLVTMAMWQLMHERFDLSEAELRARIEELDALDGKRDGRLRVQAEPRTCVACQRPMLNTSVTCPYCGQRPAETLLFP
jgi:hypothetical protein